MPILTSKNIENNEEIDGYITDLQPFLKWVGGKTQILDRLIDKFPDKINGNYYETFVGGGSVFLEIIKLLEQNKITLKGNIYVNDLNTNLINVYQFIKEHPEELIKNIEIYKIKYHELEDLTEEPEFDKAGKKKRTNTKKFDILNEDDITTKEEYYYMKRNRYNKIKDDNDKKLERAGLFIFINKTSWRGVYRENLKGEFNVPFGNYETMSMYNKRHIHSLSFYFNKHDIQFHNEDFVVFSERIKSKNDFVYLDPPYFPATLLFETKKYKFNGKKIFTFILDAETRQPIPTGKSKKVFATYNKETFGFVEQEQLRNICKSFKQKNINFIQSNSCSEWIIKNYKGFDIDKIVCKRRINSKQPQDKDFEVLISV
jgi:DNA adenine methylase